MPEASPNIPSRNSTTAPMGKTGSAWRGAPKNGVRGITPAMERRLQFDDGVEGEGVGILRNRRMRATATLGEKGRVM